MDALQALSNPPPAFTHLCNLDVEAASETSSQRPTPIPETVRYLNQETIDLICGMYGNGANISDISRQFGIHRSTLYVRLEHAGVELRPRHALGPLQVEKAARLYSGGHSLAVVGKALGVDAQTVRNHLARAGVQIRKRRGRA